MWAQQTNWKIIPHIREKAQRNENGDERKRKGIKAGTILEVVRVTKQKGQRFKS